MSAAQLDAIRRIAEVNNMIAQQELLKYELATKGLPVERIDDLLGVLRGCRCVIEASMNNDDQPPFAFPAVIPRVAA